MKKITVLVCCVVLSVCLSGCTLWPVYYSKNDVKDIAEDVVGEDIEYISKTNDKGNYRVIYNFEDEKGRAFTFTAYVQETPFIDGATLPGYVSRLRDSYLKSIYMHHKEEIDEILYRTMEENDWTINIYSCPMETEDTPQVSLAVMDSPVFITMDTHSVTEEERDEDIRQFAKMGAEIDEILSYEYHWQAEENDDIIYRYNEDCKILLNFRDGGQMDNQVDIVFSLSEETRWTEESLYENLKQQYSY